MLFNSFLTRTQGKSTAEAITTSPGKISGPRKLTIRRFGESTIHTHIDNTDKRKRFEVEAYLVHFTSIRRTTPQANSRKINHLPLPPLSATTITTTINNNMDNEWMNSVLYAGTLADERVVCATRVVDFTHELLESCTVAILLVNNTGIIVECNDLLLDLFEYEREDVMHQPVTFLLPAHSSPLSGSSSSPSALPLSTPPPPPLSNTQHPSSWSAPQPALPLSSSSTTNSSANTRSTLFATSSAGLDGVELLRRSLDGGKKRIVTFTQNKSKLVLDVSVKAFTVEHNIITQSHNNNDNNVD